MRGNGCSGESGACGQGGRRRRYSKARLSPIGVRTQANQARDDFAQKGREQVGQMGLIQVLFPLDVLQVINVFAQRMGSLNLSIQLDCKNTGQLCANSVQ